MGATPAVAKQADAGVSVIVVKYARKWACSRRNRGAGFSHAALSSCKLGPACLGCLDSSMYLLSPGSAILGKSLPSVCRDAASFESLLQTSLLVPQDWVTHGSRASCSEKQIILSLIVRR
ncbi:hypothetical protein DPMN_168373 [Dreissena polymorpha]|uniref:Uncharacterized protein n=1 Tax=Dreissena polymorpha TaxID=45954 RepID=A0A9D4F1U2_DREPO|nr:hypothetical protein DPMN_168373 [Dreissena polymorpha]